MLSARASAPSLAVLVAAPRQAQQGGRRALHVAAALTPGGGKLVDLAAGRRLAAAAPCLQLPAAASAHNPSV